MTSGKENAGERRRADRYIAQEIGYPVELTSLVPNRKPVKGELIDVSSTGVALWLPKEVEAGSHWLLVMPGKEGAGTPIKTVRTRPGFGGFIHAFKFSTPQDMLVDAIAGPSRTPKGRR